MPIGFFKELNLQVYGDGKGNIVFEEWLDDDCKFMLSIVKISVERWEQIVNNSDELIKEAVCGKDDKATP